MPRGKTKGKGEGKFAVMYESPSDTDDGPPGRVAQYCQSPEEAKELASRLNAMLRRTNPHWGGRKYGIYYVREGNADLPWIKPEMFSTHSDSGRANEDKPHGVCPRCRKFGRLCSRSRCMKCYLLDRKAAGVAS